MLTRSAPLAVLFDFDGVIVDSEPVHLRAFQRAALGNDIQLTEEQYYQELIGYDDAGAWRRVFELQGRPADDATIRRTMQDKFSHMRELLAENAIEPLAGVRELLEALKPHCALAICSAAVRDEVVTILTGVGLDSYFPVVICADDVAIAKPDPTPYLLTMRRLAEKIARPLKPQDCLVIEDAPAVIAGLRPLGFTTIGVATTRPIEHLAHADFAVPTLEREHLCPSVPPLCQFLQRDGVKA